MQLRRWNAKRLALVTCACVVVYIVFSSGYHEYQIDGVISNVGPEDVWAYVADFSKMRLMNPTILNFRIISESHTHDWQYSVLYTEKLSHWPYWLNSILADYTVIKPQTLSDIDSQPPTFKVYSHHQTCFFNGAYCLNAKSEFKFSALGKNTYCTEKISYQCPPFLKSACKRELEYQRKAVMYNLTAIFSKKH